MLELLERQTKLTKNQWKIIATANLGDMLDFFDFFLIGYALAIIPKDWHLTYGQSTVSCCPPASAPSPAPFWGWMADRFGRRKVFIATAVNVAFATGTPRERRRCAEPRSILTPPCGSLGATKLLLVTPLGSVRSPRHPIPIFPGYSHIHSQRIHKTRLQ